MRWIIISFLCSILLFSCDAPLVFKEAQPRGIPAENSFNLVYQGVFLCSEDSAVVKIEPRCIYKEKMYQFNIATEDIDSIDQLEYVEGKLSSEFFDIYLEAEPISEDSLRANVILRDTFFVIGENAVLKHFKGHQILNFKVAEDKWDVWLLSLDNQFNLVLHQTVLPEELEDLEALTPIEDISTEDNFQLRISPSIIEFSDLMDTKLIFKACEYFERTRLQRAI